MVKSMINTSQNLFSCALRRALGIALLAGAGAAQAGSIHLTPESPAAGLTYTGISNLRGWAVSSAGIDRVELYVDGSYHSDLPIGGLRNDVLAAYPEYDEYPGVTESGFSIAYNYGNLSAGTHTIQVRAVDNDGDESTSAAISFEALGFDGVAFVSDPDSVDYSQASFTTAGSSINVTGMRVAGLSYDAVLTWHTETQQFQFTDIVPTGN